MQTAGIVIALTLGALAVIPMMVWYSLWLDRTMLPRVLRLPAPLAQTVLAVGIALPWIVTALGVWLVRG